MPAAYIEKEKVLIKNVVRVPTRFGLIWGCASCSESGEVGGRAEDVFNVISSS